MDALPPDQQRYGDKEIAKILKRASQLQRAEPARPDPSGLSLAELEDVALEAGIDVANIRRAAAELGRPIDGSLGAKLLGAPLALRLERVLTGELPADAFDLLVPILQTSTNGTGQASQVGNSLTWSSSGGNNSRRLQVLVAARNGETVIRLEESSADVALALHLGIGSGSLGGAVPGGMAVAGAAGALAGLGAGIGIFGAAYALSRYLYARTTNKRRHRMEDMFEQLVEQVTRSIATVQKLEPGVTASSGGDAE